MSYGKTNKKPHVGKRRTTRRTTGRTARRTTGLGGEMLHGGKNYKSVALFYETKPVLCDICSSNNYYQRDSTMGRSKASNYLFGSVFGTLSVFALFCNECGLARILKKENIFDKDNKKFKIEPIHNGNSIEDKMGFLHRPLKV